MFENIMYDVRENFSRRTESDINEPFLNLAGKMLCLSISQAIMAVLRIFVCIGGTLTYGLMLAADKLSEKNN